MVNVTVSVPEELKLLLAKHSEINWSEVARRAWRDKVHALELLDKLTHSSKATEKDVEELARILKKGIAEFHEKN